MTLGLSQLAFSWNSQAEPLSLGACQVSTDKEETTRDGMPWFIPPKKGKSYLEDQSLKCTFSLESRQYRCQGSVIYDCPLSSMGIPSRVRFILFAGENQRSYPVSEKIPGIGVSVRAPLSEFYNPKFPILRTVSSSSLEPFDAYTDLFFPYKIGSEVHRRIRKWHQLGYWVNQTEKLTLFPKEVAEDIQRRVRLTPSLILADLEAILEQVDVSENQLIDILSSMLDWVREEDEKELVAHLNQMLNIKYKHLYTKNVKLILE
jgi:hypothetical protein